MTTMQPHVLRVRRLARSATAPLAALVDAAHHNITPVVDKQLVLELKVGVGLAQRVEWLPSGIFRGHASPLDEHVPCTAMQLGTQRLFRGVEAPAVA